MRKWWIVGGGGGRSTTSAKDDSLAAVEIQHNKLNKDLQKLLSSPGVPLKVKKRALEEATRQKAKPNPLLRALSWVDVPRAAVVSGIAELADTLGGGKNTHNFMEGVRKHEGVGDFVHTGNKWLDRGLGFLGDVAADPLTYLTFGSAKAAQLGARGVSRRLLSEAAKEGVEQGTKSALERAATNVVRRGVGGVDEAERELIRRFVGEGVEGGLHMRVPGTKLASVLTRGRVAPKSVKLLDAGLTGHATGALREALLDMRYGKRIASLGDAITTAADLKAAAHSGDVAKAVPALGMLDAIEVGRGAAKGFHALQGRKLAKVIKGLDREDLKLLRDAIEDGTSEAAARLAEKGRTPQLRAVARWLEEVHAAAKEAGVKIGHLRDYFPRQITDELRDALKNANKGGTASRTLKPRQLRAGATFMGETLQEGTVAEIEKIAKAKGLPIEALFKDDAREILTAYLNQVSNAVGHARMVNSLRERGLLDEAAKKVTTAVYDKKAIRQQGKALAAAVAAAEAARSKFDEADRLSDQLDLLRNGPQPTPNAGHLTLARQNEFLADQARELADSPLARMHPDQFNALRAEADAAAQPLPGVEMLDQAQRDIAAMRDQAVDIGARAQELGADAVRLDDALQAGDNSLVGETPRVDDAPPPPAEPPAPKQLSLLDKPETPPAPEYEQLSLLPEVAQPTARELVDRTFATVDRLEAQHADLLAAETQAVQGMAIMDSVRQKLEAENAQRIAEIDALTGGPVQPKRAQLLAEERAYRERAAMWRARANEAVDAHIKTIANLEAARAQALADATRYGHAAVAADQLAKATRTIKGFRDQYVSILRDGWRKLGVDDALLQGKQVPAVLADHIEKMWSLRTPQGMNNFVRYYDKALGLWKAYSLLSPGFHIRNYMGGLFNNWLAGVELSNTRAYARAWRTYSRAAERGGHEAGLRALNEVDRKIIDAAVKHGVLSGGVYGAEIRQAGTEGFARGLGRANPLSLDFEPLARNLLAGEAVENRLRGALFYDRMVKFNDLDVALGDVAKYHFDYDDLTKFERNVVKRLVPFYTWTRKNFPLQVEMLIRQPGKYVRYLHLKRNMELGVDPLAEGEVEPSYFGEQMGIRSPFKLGGGQVYMTPDLPFRDLSKTFDPGQMLSMLAPPVKTPLELKAGKQFFSDIPFKDGKTAAPAVWAKIPGLMPALSHLGMAVKDVNGQWIMSDKDAYLVEQVMPILGRGRRLAPSEKRYQDRQATSLISFLFGAGARTLTPAAQYGELRRRNDNLSGLIRDWTDRGVIQKNSDKKSTAGKWWIIS